MSRMLILVFIQLTIFIFIVHGQEADTTLSDALDSCRIVDLSLQETENVIRCFPASDTNDVVQENSVCLISRDVRAQYKPDKNEIALQRCVHGHWTDESLGDKVAVKKRFIGLIIFAVAAAAAITCAIFCPRGGTPPAYKANKPPTFPNPCRPPNLDDKYYVKPRETSVVVSWTDPKATDSDGHIRSVKQTRGTKNGGSFSGASGYGKEHTIIYVATDNEGLKAHCEFSFRVIIPTCSAAPWPSNGRRSCDRKSNLGSVCTYSCDTGYTLSGSSKVTCAGGHSPTWSSTTSCKKIRCSKPPPLTNGRISCSGSTFEYMTTCQIECNDGFKPSGPSFTKCKGDNKWSSLNSIKCIDNEPPKISCLTPQIFYADRGLNSTTPNWMQPEVTDNTDPNPKLSQTKGPRNGKVLEVGTTVVKYKAKDRYGNVSPECKIDIKIEETTCQHPRDKMQDPHMEFSCTAFTYTYGTECSLSCLYKIPLAGGDRITCERDDPLNPAVGSWDWGNGIKPFCNKTDCPSLDPPINGAITEDYAGATKVVTMFCNDQFDIPPIKGFYGQLFCLNNGVYSPNMQALPDCTVPRSPRAVRLQTKLYYYSGDCKDAATKQQITANLKEILKTSLNPIIRAACPAANNCTTDKLTVTCGEKRVRRKRNIQLPLYDNTAHHTRRIRRQELTTLVVEFDIVTHLDSNEDFYTSLDEVDNIQKNDLKPLLQELVNNRTFDMDLGELKLKPHSLKTADFGNLDCPEGHLLDKFKCAPCPPTYFLNSSSQCELCPIGQYADQAGLTECKACQKGYTTLKSGSRNESQCKEKCPAGKYSSNGVVPCIPCPVGYYQNDIGRRACIECKTGTTESTGSVSTNACQAFEVRLKNTDGVIKTGSFEMNTGQITFMFWTKRYANLTTTSSIGLTFGGSHLVLIHLTNEVMVESPFAKGSITLGPLTNTAWVHIAVTVDQVAETLKVYKGGSHAQSYKLKTIPPMTDGIISLQSNGTTGVSIADLHVEDRVISPFEIRSFSTICWTHRPNDVFSLDSLRGANLKGVHIQIPLSCDPIDECADNPCNNHTCTNLLNSFTCSCTEGWSGSTCMIPPDNCIDNECENGATCVSGDKDYTCVCPPSYTGDLCEVAPVHGGWSEWTVNEDCSYPCNGKTRTRTRSCDNPEPSALGNNCSGDASETQVCGQEPCPVCPALARSEKMIQSCWGNDTTDLQTCKVSCMEGYVIPDNLNFEEYKCGLTTNYTWLPMANPPDCVDPGKPYRLELMSAIDYATTIASQDTHTVEQSVTDNMSGVPCVEAGLCSTNIHLSPLGRKRSGASTLAFTFTVELNDTSDLDIQGYIKNKTVSPSLQELVDVIVSLEKSAAYINTSSNSIFDINVNGVNYSSNPASLGFSPNTSCPVCQTSSSGICVPCSEGTYYNDGACELCETGTYSDSKGQESCTPCPFDSLTASVGSYTLEQCIVNGGWSGWTDYTDCTVTCNGGTQTRTRSCDNPEPSALGANCSGDASETKVCGQEPCPIHGGWSEWTDYSDCTVTCNGGTQTRTRSCDNPEPSALGTKCSGHAIETQVCCLEPCPVHGGWSEWTDYTDCTVTCNGGTQTRIRSCDNPAPSALGAICSGDSIETQVCGEDSCPVTTTTVATTTTTRDVTTTETVKKKPVRPMLIMRIKVDVQDPINVKHRRVKQQFSD